MGGSGSGANARRRSKLVKRSIGFTGGPSLSEVEEFSVSGSGKTVVSFISILIPLEFQLHRIRFRRKHTASCRNGPANSLQPMCQLTPEFQENPGPVTNRRSSDRDKWFAAVSQTLARYSVARTREFISMWRSPCAQSITYRKRLVPNCKQLERGPMEG
jgi:hypothetical protein